MPADLDRRPGIDPDLHGKLHRWIAASLITPEEAEAIETFEDSVAPATSVGPRPVPLVTEALIYVGAALAVAAAGVLMGDRWEDLTPAVRVASVGAAFLVTLGAGLLLRRSPDPAMSRVTSVAWFVATGLFGWLAALVAYDLLELRGRVPALVAGVAATALGGTLYALLHRALQQIALFAALVVLGATLWPEGTSATLGMLALWAFAAAWIVLGSFRILPPKRAAFVVGPLVALYVPAMMTANEGGESSWMWLGLATGIALVVASVVLHEILLLGFGALGFLVYTILVLVRFFGGTAVMPIALLVAGAVVLTLAIAYARRSGRSGATRTAPRSPW